MGSFVAFVSTAIMFYYSVVTGWFLKYFIYFVTHDTTNIDTAKVWSDFTANQSLSTFWNTPGFYQFLALGATATVVYFGVSKGIEKANRFLIPALFTLLFVAAINVVFLPGFGKGMNYLFDFEFSQLADHKVWLNALSQSAWSTGAGWGLLLTYSVYAAKNEDPVVSSTVIALGNNSASLLAAIIIVPTIFSFNTVGRKPEHYGRGQRRSCLCPTAAVVFKDAFWSGTAGGIFSGSLFRRFFFHAVAAGTPGPADHGFWCQPQKSHHLRRLCRFPVGAALGTGYQRFKNQDWFGDWG